jgi:hypothetical protein
MFRRKVQKVLLTATGNNSSRPIPVQQSQRVQMQEQEERENRSGHSQGDLFLNETRFKSQRASLARQTQQQIDKGKNSLEIILYNHGLVFGDISKCDIKIL